jgi:hypothetical protein
MSVPEEKRNIWRKRPFRPKEQTILEVEVRTDLTTARRLVIYRVIQKEVYTFKNLLYKYY